MNGRTPIDPRAHTGWDEALPPDADVFHTLGWARVLAETYGYRPVYWTADGAGPDRGVLPMMEVRSALTGRRGVSLPFTDCCRAAGPGGAADLLDDIKAWGRRSGWRLAEWRGAAPGGDAIPACEFLRYTLDLRGGAEGVLRGADQNTRRNLRKAERAGVRVEAAGTPEAMALFVRLNAVTRRRHGLPPQPRRFFEMLQTHLVRPGAGRLALAWRGREPVAGAIFLHFRGRAVYKYGASAETRGGVPGANPALLADAIRWYAARGAERLDLGRVWPGNTGLRRYKRGWGGEEERLAYYRYAFRRGTFVTGAPPVAGRHNALFRRMPVWLLRAVGRAAYRHMG
ncbi:MAG: GNAT family N-acetyltransferase [Lentisphaerae bacterium]|nr:GNAT family N-acetyltransferase [Lentisphaerota bacterium]